MSLKAEQVKGWESKHAGRGRLRRFYKRQAARLRRLTGRRDPEAPTRVVSGWAW